MSLKQHSPVTQQNLWLQFEQSLRRTEEIFCIYTIHTLCTHTHTHLTLILTMKEHKYEQNLVCEQKYVQFITVPHVTHSSVHQNIFTLTSDPGSAAGFHFPFPPGGRIIVRNSTTITTPPEAVITSFSVYKEKKGSVVSVVHLHQVWSQQALCIPDKNKDL